MSKCCVVVIYVEYIPWILHIELMLYWNLVLVSFTLMLQVISRGLFVYAPCQWETTLHCNFVSHLLGTYTKWSLYFSGFGTIIPMSVYKHSPTTMPWYLLFLRSYQCSFIHMTACLGYKCAPCDHWKLPRQHNYLIKDNLSAQFPSLLSRNIPNHPIN